MIICVGSRLTIKQTGYNHEDFGRNAYKIYVDIDADELKKENLHPDISICSDAKEFFKPIIKKSIGDLNINQWQNECKELFNKQRIVLDKHIKNESFVSNYVLIDKLSSLNNGEIPIITIFIPTYLYIGRCTTLNLNTSIL